MTKNDNSASFLAEQSTDSAPDSALDLAEHDSRSRWLERGPNQFPSPWASEWGFDEYGLWQTFVLRGDKGEGGKDISHKMRFIPKGEFLMGSPEDEQHRSDKEMLHCVKLTNGYWLGETTISQALWQQVMGKNPSRFQKKENQLNFNTHGLPVEQISWHDSQKFCQALNKRISGLSLTLPSEAQWEYACRAGTRSAYAVGNDLTKLT
ncbi:MAG: formylglycine-generating enzyme family protein, partial [Alteromonas sp.]|nr:formylglycine-generating enzyme family protein [Alteromonas sp.]